MGSSLEVILPLTALAYLSGTWLGAISVCRWAGRPDPRLSGSCNPGFSNVLRQHGVPLALATLAIDALKSWPVLLLGLWLELPPWGLGLVGLGVLLGHCYPAWYRFRGGKAVASAFGVMLLLTPGVALVSAVIWALLAWWAHTAAVASLTSATLAPLLSLWLAPDFVWVVLVFAGLVVARHAINIGRLRQGKEPHL
ncbi:MULTISPECIES: glycerol-3-phosphate acyltransferase [Halomonas]|uniref:Glycerol-3-phosphate acyltransferase n=2 Tax=Halomonas TaxID=2745 RepID=A0AAU7KWC2_9GAMM|nr:MULTISPECIES: glycerol-3-phosphate acyltransferase [Halomonas]MBR9771411.1 glycerol-3-phosphate acyltransferase [Gammaproteobacteria bacterium]MBS8268273.1 glycerol-3-phosphate acyltransferase [Halomonas litopenaei]MBY5939824.1 glycerol-3-phosphate acyltransferase [Halomonas sp. DP5N14-9]MBY6109385.1 glycerol-3-phosphate acyltransferase [Halomonas sp. DP1Y21-3]MCJ8284154.1 glycerol-3-phosphate acyltransferase [Halomonas sp.]|tara:strand:+ start:543 stop:1130 length:588 start_codon:yes stop_codon:yes gene_type:complete